MSSNSLTTPFLIAPRVPARPAPLVAALPAPRHTRPRFADWSVAVKAAWRRYRTRQLLASLDGHLLKDIGLSYSEAEHEANKPFWRG